MEQLLWTDARQPRLVPNAANAKAILTLHPHWHSVFGFNEFIGQQTRMRSLPRDGRSSILSSACPLDENDIIQTQVILQQTEMPRISKDCVRDAIAVVSRQNSFDPLKDYMTRCRDEWDGIARLHRFFIDYFVAKEDGAYVRALGPIAVMTLVLRAVHPGAFQKMVPILEGPQNIGKSKGLAALCPDAAWFGDALPSLKNKDVSTYLLGKFLIEIAELAATKREDIDVLKSFLSRTVEKYRRPYGHLDVEEPRRCMFWGTTNRSDYLRDESGNCRFYPVVLRKVAVEDIRRDRDQLLGEALVRLEKAESDGEAWWELPPAAEIEITELRSSRGDDHPWTSIVLKFIEGFDEVAIPMLMQDYYPSREEHPRKGLDIPKERRTRADSNAIAGIMTQFGWQRAGKFSSGSWKGQARFIPPQEDP
jgi:predicted P-loop ATPase